MKLAVKTPAPTEETVHLKPHRADLTRKQLCHLRQLADAQECVSHPSFGLSETEEELFGSNTPEVQISTWNNFARITGLRDSASTQNQKPTRLKGSDEARLFLQYNYARYRLARLGNTPGEKPTVDRQTEMTRWYQRAMRLRSKLTAANLALVVAMAKRTNIQGVDFGELISEGNMALLRAIEKFDVSRGFKFSTYACRVILKGFYRMANKANKHNTRFGTELDPGMEPGDQTEIKRQEIRNNSLSVLHKILQKNKAELSKKERWIIDQRFGLTEERKKRTLVSIGEELGVSKERVRQLQRAALAKLRRMFKKEASPI
ncbi:MAG: sigma-70 family RNA polymerase sigma factor [Phycisphaerales bacterium]|jgi:RNA polymerase primary sigma factor|nr:sigma-70 family RNA polymerase sigma factor [Phycisphaerales bacterium]